MKKTLLLVPFIILFPIISTATGYKFKVNVDVAPNHVQGTPIMAKVTVCNAMHEDFEMTSGGGGNWFYGEKLCGHMAMIDTVPLDPNAPLSNSKPDKYPANWVKVYSFDLAEYCDLKSPSQYGLEYRYAKPDGTLLADPVTVNFSIDAPVGEDKTAYDSYQACLDRAQKAKDDSWRQCKDRLLADHPTSTYAGWQLSSPGADLARTSGKDLIVDMLKPVPERERWGTFVENDYGKKFPKTKDGKYFIKSAGIEAQEYLNFSEAFLPAHPDHPNAGIIYARTALAYMVLNRWQEAFLAAKKSLELPWAEWVYSGNLQRLETEKKVLREAKDELLQRGLAKDKDK